MKKITLLTCSVMLLAMTGLSQSAIGSAAGRQAKWQRTQEIKTGNIDRAIFKAMAKQSEVFAGFLRDSCLAGYPERTEWHGEYESSGPQSNRQLASTLVCRFSGEDKGVYEQPSQVELRVAINDLRPLFSDSLVIHQKPYAFLLSQPVVGSEGLFFEGAVRYHNMTPGSMPGRIKMWLVLPEKAETPYIPLTRREYLREASSELTEERSMTVDRVKQQTPVRPDNVQKKEKEAEIAMINQTCTGMQLQVRMRNFLAKYKPDEVWQQEAIDAATAPLDSTLKLMEQLLAKLPAPELEKPAFVSVPAREFQGFEDLITSKGMLVKPNPAFVASYAGSIVPNFFIVYWIAGRGPGDEWLSRIQPVKLRQFLK